MSDTTLTFYLQVQGLVIQLVGVLLLTKKIFSVLFHTMIEFK